MAYRLKSGESIPEGIKRIACEEIDSALEQLTGKAGSAQDVAIHEARKNIKKTRAVLKLMRPELIAVHKKENRELRDTGRKLSEFRDAKAVIDTLDAMKQKYADQLNGHNLDATRQALVERKEAKEKSPELAGVLEEATRTIGKIRSRVERWPLKADGFDAIAPGLMDIYRAGRKSLARAEKRPRPENYHELRKRVKDHWYHVRLLESIWTDVMLAYEKDLKSLETWLGEDHNLVVLHDEISAKPSAFGGNKEVKFTLKLIADYQKELRSEAKSLAERVYAEKPKEFGDRMKKLWLAWINQPAVLDELQKEERKAAKEEPTHRRRSRKPAARKAKH